MMLNGERRDPAAIAAALQYSRQSVAIDTRALRETSIDAIQIPSKSESPRWLASADLYLIAEVGDPWGLILHPLPMDVIS